MRWFKEYTEPEDTRIVKTFALMPTRMSDNKTVVWLEWYKEIQVHLYDVNTASYQWKTTKVYPK